MESGDSSIEYIEDPYFNSHIGTATPSLDEVEEEDPSYLIIGSFHESEYDLFDFDSDNCKSLESNDGSLNIETEFYNDVNRNENILKKLFGKVKKKQVRVIYSDLTKPFMVKIPCEKRFKEYLGLTSPNEVTEQTNMTEDELNQQKEVWRSELAQIEDEIATLRTVLASKIRTSNDIKQKLGISVWKEITEDVNQGIRNVKESSVFQKTSSILGGITGSVTNKIGQMRHSESFRSIEEKVGSAYENVKTKVIPSRSNSTQSLDDALNQHQAGAARTPVATSPTIAEEKPIA